MFPIIPVPNFLVEMYPILAEMHKGAAWIGAVGFAFYGLLLFLLWVPNYESSSYDLKEIARERIQFGAQLIALAVVSLLTGVYVWTLLIIGLLVFMLWVLARGIIIALKG